MRIHRHILLYKAEDPTPFMYRVDLARLIASGTKHIICGLVKKSVSINVPKTHGVELGEKLVDPLSWIVSAGVGLAGSRLAVQYVDGRHDVQHLGPRHEAVIVQIV